MRRFENGMMHTYCRHVGGCTYWGGEGMGGDGCVFGRKKGGGEVMRSLDGGGG